MAESVVSYDRDLPQIAGRLPWEAPRSYLVKEDGAPTGWREDRSGRRPSGLLLVPKIRDAVDAWRAAGYDGASDVTRRLFAYEGGPRAGPPGHFGSYAGGRHNFGGEDAAPRPAGCGGREAGSGATADRNFGSEGGRRDQPRHPGGGQTRGLAARPRPLQLRGPHQQAPLRLPTPAADRSRRAIRPRRRRRAEQSQAAVRRSSPPPPRRNRMRRQPRRRPSGAGPV